MRRLLQIGTLILLATTILVPLSESFDRWDAPGLSNDTEFHLFAIVLFLALVLLLCRHLAAASAWVIAVFQQFVLRNLPLRKFFCNALQPVFDVPPLASPHATHALLLSQLRI